MKASEAIDLIMRAYEKAVEKSIPRETRLVVQGIRSIREVFDSSPTLPALKWLIDLMFLPTDERVEPWLMSKHFQKDEGHCIKLNLTHGLGLEIPVEEQLEILMLLDSSEFRLTDFNIAMSRAWAKLAAKYKAKITTKTAAFACCA